VGADVPRRGPGTEQESGGAGCGWFATTHPALAVPGVFSAVVRSTSSVESIGWGRVFLAAAVRRSVPALAGRPIESGPETDTVLAGSRAAGNPRTLPGVSPRPMGH